MSSNHSVYEVEAILFDMDGTIVDSSVPVQKAWKQWADSQGIDFARVLEVMHGRRAVETMQLLAPHLPQPATVDRFLEEEELDVEGIVAIPGAAQFIASLPWDRWAVVTSATQSMARSRIRAAGLPDPKVVVSADMVAHGKPHPECFLRAAELLGVPPAHCLVFEDAPAGIASAKAAGIPIVGIETHYSGEVLGVAPAVANFQSIAGGTLPGGAIRVTVRHGLD
jgi:mannitol-1-/sugar-/sorbitol-6-phosphatase